MGKKDGTVARQACIKIRKCDKERDGLFPLFYYPECSEISQYLPIVH